IALKTGAGDYVEDTVGAIAVFGRITAALHFNTVDVLGIELRTDVRGDAGVRNRNSIEQPGNLMASANVQLVVDDVGAGDVIRDHGDAVASRGAGSFGNLTTIDDGGGSRGIRINAFESVPHLDRLVRLGNAEREVQTGLSAGA